MKRDPPKADSLSHRDWHSHLEPGGHSDIWVSDAEGAEPRAVTSDPAADSMPSWFPAGDRILFLSNRQGHFGLWTLELSTRMATLLRDVGEGIDSPRLSPDGTRIAFNWARGGSTINTWVVPVHGGEPRQLTFDREFLGFACWSPDGRLLALQMRRAGGTHIAVMPSGGGTATQLTSDEGESWPHSWSPDGDKIAFAANRGGLWNVRWVSRTTQEQVQVTDQSKLNAYVRYPAWSPRGDRIAFEYAETAGNIWMVENLP